jgi:hypothetical protein
MRIKFIEQWKFRLLGRSVPVIRVIDQDEIGLVKSIELISGMKDRPNSLSNTWDVTGYEKDPAYGPIWVINEKGLKELRYVVSTKGRTVGLYTQINAYPNAERVFGTGSMMDDLADSMDLAKSVKNIVIGLLIGIMIGWIFIAPIVNGMAK